MVMISITPDIQVDLDQLIERMLLPLDNITRTKFFYKCPSPNWKSFVCSARRQCSNWRVALAFRCGWNPAAIRFVIRRGGTDSAIRRPCRQSHFAGRRTCPSAAVPAICLELRGIRRSSRSTVSAASVRGRSARQTHNPASHNRILF